MSSPVSDEFAVEENLLALLFAVFQRVGRNGPDDELRMQTTTFHHTLPARNGFNFFG